MSQLLDRTQTNPISTLIGSLLANYVANPLILKILWNWLSSSMYLGVSLTFLQALVVLLLARMLFSHSR